VAALLRFAHEAALDPRRPELLQPLREAGLGEAEVKEAVATLALFRMVNAWTDLLAIPVDGV
jgi:alkylhydroperoxidase family enzyme